MKLRKIVPKKMNKKGNALIPIIFIGLLFVVMFIGFMMVTGSSIVNYVFDTVVPEFYLGDVAGTNMTEVSGYTVDVVNDVVQSFTWLTGVLYFMMLVGVIGIAFAFRQTPDTWLIGFYFGLMLILVIGAIFISNIYEDFYDDSGELGDRLKEHTLLSWLVLYSPMVMTIIGFIGGVVLFSGREEF